MQSASNNVKRPQRTPLAHLMARVVLAMGSLVVGGAAGWILTRAWLSAHGSVTAPGPAASDELLALAAASIALAIVAWLGLSTVLEVLARLPGRVGRLAQGWSDRLTPVLARRVAAFVLGVGVGVAGGPTQAVAHPRPSSTVASVADPGFVPSLPVPDPGFGPTAAAPGLTPATRPAPTLPAPGFTPAAPRVRPQPDPGLVGGRPSPATGDEVVVHRGDTLWSIAARHLGPQASDAEIAAAWPRWFAQNRGLIGDDPDLILPGQILRAPDTDETVSVHR
ncbi:MULTISPECIES: LysM peptidoglycan-binding domain-containing protein [unclassified Knoellia]|uniref:LysM peptidoglycan-binding domain-containing protein n=1 Tax=Knoellia altitudinis TaxID=3404795 RepID=UPI00360B5ACF